MQVLEKETLNFHNCIEWDLRGKNRQRTRNMYVKDKVDRLKSRELLDVESEFTGPADSLEAGITTLQRITGRAKTKMTLDGKGNCIYWWTLNIQKARREACPARRKLTRARGL